MNKFTTNNVQIKWIDVLQGRNDRIQVWTKLEAYRNFSSNIKQYSNTQDGKTDPFKILSFIYNKLCCDTIATQFLSSKFYLFQSQQQSYELSKQNKKINKMQLTKVIDFSSNDYIAVHNEIENTFLDAITKCFTDFTEISSPILSRDQILHLVNIYKTKLKSHYEFTKQLFAFDKKMQESRNSHLLLSHYYDRLLFYQYLAQSRIRYNHNFAYWGVINTCSIYGKGQGRTRSQSSSYFGYCTTIQTLMKKTKDLRDNLDSAIYLRLKDEKKIVCCVDNNQKGNKLKFQRFGKSNKFMKVTGSVIIQYKYCHPNCGYIKDKVEITYFCQAIPSPYLFPHFEKLIDFRLKRISSYNLNRVISDMTTVNKQNRMLHIYPNVNTENVDFTGKRTEAYISICKTVALSDMVRKTCSGSYISTSSSFKFVNFSPDKWKSSQTKNFLVYFHKLKEKILNKKTSLFQYNTVLCWNPSATNISKVIVPRIFLYDKITTDGYGKVIIELLTKHGIITKTNSDKDCFRWILSPNWEKKTMVLCLDGLSLDRHRSFLNKLCNLPMNFSNSYKQSLIFQKALSRVIQISGLLHTTFHMLQAIYSIYKLVMQCTQNCLGWRKINMSKVSDKLLSIHYTGGFDDSLF